MGKEAEKANCPGAHLAWCGLVALMTVRNDGIIKTPAQENMFLIRWLALAEKRRLFRKEVAADIRWLLNEGRTKGPYADLSGKLWYLWRVGNGDLLKQTDLYRLQHVLESIQLGGWTYYVLNEEEWAVLAPKSASSALYLSRQRLESAFSEAGSLLQPFPIRIGGKPAGIDQMLDRAGFLRTADPDDNSLHFLSVTPDEAI